MSQLLLLSWELLASWVPLLPCVSLPRISQVQLTSLLPLVSWVLLLGLVSQVPIVPLVLLFHRKLLVSQVPSCLGCFSVSVAALVLGAVLDIGAFLSASVTGASGVTEATLFLRATGVCCRSCHGCFWVLGCRSFHGCCFTVSVTVVAGISLAALVLGVSGVSSVTLLRVPLVSQVSLLSWLSLVSLLPLEAQVSLLLRVLLLPWLVLLPQVQQMPLFLGAALSIGADVTVCVMSAAGLSGATLFLGAVVVSGVTL